MAGKPALARGAALVLVLAAAACGGSSVGATVPTKAPPSVRLPDFAHVVLVVFENHEATSIAGALLIFWLITHFGKKWLENRL